MYVMPPNWWLLPTGDQVSGQQCQEQGSILTSWDRPYPTASIIRGCKMFVTLIDKATGGARLRPVALKSEVKGFLIHEVRALITKDQKPVVVIQTNNS